MAAFQILVSPSSVRTHTLHSSTSEPGFIAVLYTLQDAICELKVVSAAPPEVSLLRFCEIVGVFTAHEVLLYIQRSWCRSRMRYNNNYRHMIASFIPFPRHYVCSWDKITSASATVHASLSRGESF